MFNRKDRRGFTLIELLVVIAIIGILSSIVLASLNTARQKGRDARRIADIKQIQLALELAYDAAGSYPATTSVAALVTPGYISVVPTDPSNQAAYSYSPISTTGTPAVCVGYHLGASLEATNNALLSDANMTAAYPSGYGLCTGGVANFDGSNNNAKCAPGDIGTHCYDVKT